MTLKHLYVKSTSLRNRTQVNKVSRLLHSDFFHYFRSLSPRQVPKVFRPDCQPVEHVQIQGLPPRHDVIHRCFSNSYSSPALTLSGPQASPVCEVRSRVLVMFYRHLGQKLFLPELPPMTDCTTQ